MYVRPEESTLFEKILRPSGVMPARVSEVPLTEAIIEMVKAGLGISALAGWAVEEQIRAGKIAARSITSKGLHRQWQAVTIKQDSTPAYINEFIVLLFRPAMPLVKPGIVRFASSKRCLVAALSIVLLFLGGTGERQPFLCKDECQESNGLGSARVSRDLVRAARIFVKHLAGTVCGFRRPGDFGDNLSLQHVSQDESRMPVGSSYVSRRQRKFAHNRSTSKAYCAALRYLGINAIL